MVADNERTEFIPVLTETDEALLLESISQPFSYVSTDGPIWRSSAQRLRYVRDERKSHLVVRTSAGVIGSVTWSPGQTPGFHRLIINSCHDAAWTSAMVGQAMVTAVSLLRRAADVRRVELLVATYNEVLLEYLTDFGHFEVEGVLRDRFFIDGKYWSAVICCADLSRFPMAGKAAGPGRQELLAKLRKKTLEDLTTAHDSASWRA